MISIDPKRTFDWVLPSEEGEPNPATLVLRPMTVRERQSLYPKVNSTNLAVVSDTVWEVLERNVVGWRNFSDPNGNSLDFDKEHLDHLSDEAAMGAYEAILGASSMKPEEAGNS